MNFIFAAFVALNALALVSSSPLIINKNKQMRVDLFEGDIAEIDIEQVKVKKKNFFKFTQLNRIKTKF